MKESTAAELLIHSKKLKDNLIKDVQDLFPHLTTEGQRLLKSLVRRYKHSANEENKLHIEAEFDNIYSSLYVKLSIVCPALTWTEKRLCALYINHSYSEIARLLCKKPNAVIVAGNRIKTKLKISTSKEFRRFVSELSPHEGQRP